MSAFLELRQCAGCGESFSVRSKYAHRAKWCSERCRKSQYAGVCELCGGPTDGTSPSRGVARVCQSCLSWSEEAIVDAIRRWAEEHGGIPPTTTEWRCARDGFPCATTVGERIGWNETLLRAGFSLHCDRRPETQERIEAQIRAGVPLAEIADGLGVSPNAIRMRLRVRGLSVRELRRPGAA